MPGELPSPADPLFRIGRSPEPLAWVPWNNAGTGRFDDPRERPAYRVLYAGERLACFYEAFAEFRVDLDGIARQGITEEWLGGRRIGGLMLTDPDRSGRWLDFASPATYGDFRVRFGTLLRALGYQDFDVSVATNDDRELSQEVGRWAFDNGYQGIRYPTRHHPRLSCWAIFEGTPFAVEDAGSVITFEDPDLQAVAEAWQMTLPNPA